MHYLLRTTIILFLIVVFNNNAISQQTIVKSTAQIQATWLKALQNSESLELFYTDNNGILLNDTLYLGLEKIAQQLQTLGGRQFEKYLVKEVFQLHDNNKFELGE